MSQALGAEAYTERESVFSAMKDLPGVSPIIRQTAAPVQLPGPGSDTGDNVVPLSRPGRGRFVQIPVTVLISPLSANAVRLYGILDSHSDGAKMSYPSRATLAREMGVSARYVDTLLTELIDYGAVRKERRRDGSKNFTNLYWVLDPPPS